MEFYKGMKVIKVKRYRAVKKMRKQKKALEIAKRDQRGYF